MDFQTYSRLGIGNIARVATYRLGLLLNLHPVVRLSADLGKGPFLRQSERRAPVPAPNKSWNAVLLWFGWSRADLQETPPDWFANPFTELPQPNVSSDWWRIPDFGKGDIKGLWELSRFDWLVSCATCVANGDTQALDRLNSWLSNWIEANPAFKGPNWKCGQEASIRVMHLVLAAWILDQETTPEAGLVALIRAHLQRIAPTMSYAIGQQNNHGTSEAAALFIGGSFLSKHDKRAKAWERTGRRWLEERAATLIAKDGSFSQHSVNYHRMMLDTYSLAEAWRCHKNLTPFSSRLKSRLAAATEWLWTFTDASTGDAPNIGANDGARLMPLVDSDYRDFRPSVQLATALFRDADAFGYGPWTVPLRWLRVADQKARVVAHSKSFDDGGYHVLRTHNVMAVLRYPRFRFRPSQADALHLDLWRNGLNLLRDAGTFSYNAKGAEWFSGTAAHNTIEFDERDQMPRLGRFLFGDWLAAKNVSLVKEEYGSLTASAGYSDALGAQHQRAITLTDEGLICTDTISGSFRNACLRWRLVPGNWQLENNALCSEHCAISIEIDGKSIAPTLGTTEESRYYLHKTNIPVASVSVDHAATIITKVTF